MPSLTWRERVKEVEKALATPLILIVPTMLLIMVGFILAVRGPDHYGKLIGFALACLVVYHLVFWWSRAETTDKALKVVDYIFLVLGFVGVFGALDVQANMYKSKIPEVIGRHQPSIDSADPCKGDTRGQAGCHWPDVVKIVLKRPYNHILLEMQFDKERLGAAYPDGISKPHQEFIDEVRSLYDAMQKEVFQYIDPVEHFEIDKKIFAYYILCVGLALRLTKVTAEVFEWHVPKKATVAEVLPKEEPDAHNPA